MKPLMINFGTFAILADRVIMVKPDGFGIKIEYAGRDGEYFAFSKMSYDEFIAKYERMEEQSGRTS